MCPFPSSPRVLCNLKANDEALAIHFTGWEKKNKAAKKAAAWLGRSKEEQSYMTFSMLNKFCISSLFQWLSSPWRGNKKTLEIDY